jgi:hypothetical protein
MRPVQALQVALAGEHAAVYVYGVLGGRVSTSADAALSRRLILGYTRHRSRRDELISRVRSADAVPVEAEVSYEVANPALTSSQLERAALQIELRCSALYADVVGSTSGADRRWAIDALTDCAVRQLGFGGSAAPFPGAAELA